MKLALEEKSARFSYVFCFRVALVAHDRYRHVCFHPRVAKTAPVDRAKAETMAGDSKDKREENRKSKDGGKDKEAQIKAKEGNNNEKSGEDERYEKLFGMMKELSNTVAALGNQVNENLKVVNDPEAQQSNAGVHDLSYDSMYENI